MAAQVAIILLSLSELWSVLTRWIPGLRLPLINLVQLRVYALMRALEPVSEQPSSAVCLGYRGRM